MEKKLLIVLSLFVSFGVFAQSSEFPVYENGLIYTPTTMNKLKHIVDSLNLKYKSCDLNKTFYAINQTIGYSFYLKKGNIKQAKKDIDNNISFEDFVKKYPKTEIDKESLILRFETRGRVEFSEVNIKGGYSRREIQKKVDEIDKENLANTWLYDYYEGSEYSNESIQGFFFPKEFSSKPMVEKYARMIGYSDCLIDTTTVKFKEDAEYGYWSQLPENWVNLSQRKKERLLDKMRSTRVVGGCSQDHTPRLHAMNIALLSAETTNWEVFLKSHLDIMNDRFERVSDGSYAWAGRQTYIKELEDLDINILDLIFGISLRVENPAENHYYGSIGRLGRALSETQNRDKVEQSMLSMIEDSKLDDYNRVLIMFLYMNYAHYSGDENQKKVLLEKLKASVQKMPNYIRDKVKIE